MYPYPQQPQPPSGKRVTAGILALLFGGLGVHKFYLGYTTEGLIMLVATLCTCGLVHIVGFIEGIIYLTKSDQDFDSTYVYNQRTWF